MLVFLCTKKGNSAASNTSSLTTVVLNLIGIKNDKRKEKGVKFYYKHKRKLDRPCARCLLAVRTTGDWKV